MILLESLNTHDHLIIKRSKKYRVFLIWSWQQMRNQIFSIGQVSVDEVVSNF